MTVGLLSGSYGESESLQGLSMQQVRFSNVSIGTNYRRQFSQRLSAFVSGQYVDRINSVRQSGTDIMGSLGLSYRLGR